MADEPDFALAKRLFAELAEKTKGDVGICRDSYGSGEELAHQLVRSAAIDIGLEVNEDFARNLYITLPGEDPMLPALVIGSHLDSVPQGGNFDGAAGVLAGLAVVAALAKAGRRAPFNITVAAFRMEEAAWFNVAYGGSHAAFGKLPASDLAVKRSDNGRTLADHMTEMGCDVAAVRAGTPYLRPKILRGYIEPHIEQGPVLQTSNYPVGIVTTIRGCLRYRNAQCHGAYAHSGAEPRRTRQDAVAATCELIAAINAEWRRVEQRGDDLNFTVGELTTDPRMHGPSKVAGETRFVLDFRSTSGEIMRNIAGFAKDRAGQIEVQYNVNFEFGTESYAEPATMDVAMADGLKRAARDLRIDAKLLPSGAGHDAVVFSKLGVPAAMIFIRNQNGSHNPFERMAFEDFAVATRVLFRFIDTLIGR